MASLLPGTFFIAGAHTIAWLPRPFQYCRQLMATHSLEDKGYFRRFQPLQRNLHLTVITSIFGLAITGMMLKFSCATWARFVAWLLGGFEAAGVIHRACATATFGYFGFQIADLVQKERAAGKTWLEFATGPESMMFC